VDTKIRGTVHDDSYDSTLLQPTSLSNLCLDVQLPVLTFQVKHPLVIVSQGWPCWLPSASALRLPIVQCYLPTKFHEFFPTLECKTALEFNQQHYMQGMLLGSGSRNFWLSQFVPAMQQLTSGCAMYCIETPFEVVRDRSISPLWKQMVGEAARHKCFASIVRHADFGGVTSGSHLVISWNVSPESDFVPTPNTPRVLKHVIESATKGHFPVIGAPVALQTVTRMPTIVDGLQRIEGLYNVHRPTVDVACPSVFSRTGWTRRPLSRKELLRAFDIPVHMDNVLLECARVTDFCKVLTPLVAISIFCTLWGINGGWPSIRQGIRRQRS
jgi:hypothetical protein